MPYLVLAFRNVLKQTKRSLLIGVSLFVSCLVLLFGFAFANGSGEALVGRQRAAQTGDAVVLWDSVLDYEPSDGGRILFSEPDRDRASENREALAVVERYLGRHEDEIEVTFRALRFFGMLDTGAELVYCGVQGLSPAEAAWLQANGVLESWGGIGLFDTDDGLHVTEAFAREHDLVLGDWVWLDATTFDGLGNSRRFRVTGILKNGPPWDELWLFTSESSFRRLTENPAAYWSSLRVYLKDPLRAAEFASALNAELAVNAGGDAPVLLAETGEASMGVWRDLASLQKGLFAAFTFLLLVVVAIGLRSAVRLSLYERIREFGTLRAVGFGRSATFFLVFLEVLFLALVAWAAAVLAALVFAAIAASVGINVGSGAAAYVAGSELIRPRLSIGDALSAWAFMSLFAMLAVLKPGLRLCRQTVTDLLAGRQRVFSALADLLSSLFKALRRQNTRRNQGA